MATYSFAHHASRASDAAFNSYATAAVEMVDVAANAGGFVARNLVMATVSVLAAIGVVALIWPNEIPGLRARLLAITMAAYAWLSATVYAGKKEYLRAAYAYDSEFAKQRIAKEVEAAAAAKNKQDKLVAEWQAAKDRADAELAKLEGTQPVATTTVLADQSPTAAAMAALGAHPMTVGDPVIIAEGPLDPTHVAQMAAALRKNANYTVADAQRQGLETPLAPNAQGNEQDPQPLLTAAMSSSSSHRRTTLAGGFGPN